MGFLRDALSAVAEFASTPGRSYVVTLDKNGTRHYVPLDKYYTPENPPPANVLETSCIEYAARLTP